MQEETHQDTCIILDGHAIIYRAYHAFKELCDPTGKPINAVYGFARILLKVITDYDPTYIAVTFDHKNGKSKRVAQFEQYKAQRPPMPQDLIDQVQIIKDLVTAFNIPRFELDGFEADDLLGTIARQMVEKQQQSKGGGGSKEGKNPVLTVIVTGDKDILQLVVDDLVHVFIPGRGKFSTDREYDTQAVVQKLGVLPDKIPDLKALMGDPSDNIPGVKGIGQKTATKLIQEFGSLEAVYDAVDKVSADAKSAAAPASLKGSVLQKLVQDKEMAFLSKQLATITTDAPLQFDLSLCVTKEYDKDNVLKMFDTYNFTSLKSLLPKDEFEQSLQEALF